MSFGTKGGGQHSKHTWIGPLNSVPFFSIFSSFPRRVNCTRTLTDKLQRLQNRTARVLAQSSYDADANQLIKKLSWDNWETRRQKLKAKMVYKSWYGLTPSYLSSKFIQLSDMITSYNYNLRNSENKFAIPLPRTKYYKNSFSYFGAVLWNSLPSAVRQTTSLTNFRRLLINSDTAFMENRL